MLFVHERLLLLVLDERKGTCRASHAEPALAGALLVDLIRLGAIEIVDGEVRVAGGHAETPGSIADALAAISAEPKPRSARWWVDQLPRKLKPFMPRLAQRLVADGVLTQQQHKVLGLFPTTRLPERDHGCEAGVRERLRAVLVGERQPEMDDAVLAGLVDLLDLVGMVVEKPDQDDAEQRAKELARSLPADDASRAAQAAVRAAQDAVMVAVAAATAAATVAATTAAVT